MLSDCAFQPRVPVARNDDAGVITGLFGTVEDDTFTGEECKPGTLCVMGDGIPEGGYQMEAAEDGAKTLWACWPTGVNRVPVGDRHYAIGCETLGMVLHADVKGAFLKIKPDHVYAFAAGNFDGDPVSAEKPFATVENGKLKATATEPEAGDGNYFKLDLQCGIDTFNEGPRSAGARYNLMACYA